MPLEIIAGSYLWTENGKGLRNTLPWQELFVSPGSTVRRGDGAAAILWSEAATAGAEATKVSPGSTIPRGDGVAAVAWSEAAMVEAGAINVSPDSL